jgi:hypothetical protein
MKFEIVTDKTPAPDRQIVRCRVDDANDFVVEVWDNFKEDWTMIFWIEESGLVEVYLEDLPSGLRTCIKRMYQRHPVHGSFIQDMMLTPNSAAGWFLAGYLFGSDPELRKHFEATSELIGAKGVQRMMYDA